MVPSLSIAAGSAVAIALLIMLFRAEERSGKRIIFPRIRGFFDTALQYAGMQLERFCSYLGTGVFRAVFHYFVHGLLSRIIKLLGRLETYLARLQLRNKRIATGVRSNHKKTHLDEIATHKEETSLSAEEKRKRRRH